MKNRFFHTILEFTQPHSGSLGDIEGLVQLIPGSYKCDRPNNITGIDIVHSKHDCIQEFIINGVRQAILYSFALSSTLGH